MIAMHQVHTNKSYVLRTNVVSCPASLSHADKESGETRIQFWFRAPRSRCGQSDCGMVLTSRALFEKDCNANLKVPREGQSVGHSASDR